MCRYPWGEYSNEMQAKLEEAARAERGLTDLQKAALATIVTILAAIAVVMLVFL